MPGRAAGAHARNLGVAGGGYGFPAGRWQAIKMAFSKRTAAGEALSATRRGRGEHGIWQRRYWEHTIRNDHKSVAVWLYPLRGQPRTVRRMIGASGVESSGGSELIVEPVVGG